MACFAAATRATAAHRHQADTDFRSASDAPSGLRPDAWNVRLIPHYSLGVWFVITHLGLGLRG